MRTLALHAPKLRKISKIAKTRPAREDNSLLHPPEFLAQTLLRHSRFFIAVFQSTLIFLALVGAWLLRFDFSLPHRALLLLAAPILILLRLIALAAFGLSHGWWRYSGVNDAFDVLKGTALGSAAFFITIRWALSLSAFPRSIYFLEPILTLALLTGVRLSSRAFFDSVHRDALAKRVAIIGAGVAAQMILRELRQPRSNCLAVACFDDDPSKHGMKIQGVPVMGAINDLPAVLARHPVSEILIAIPSANAAQMRRIVSACDKTGVGFRTVPSLRELLSSSVTVNQIRDVNLEDLLEREPVHLDLTSVGPKIRDKTVLVTGAAGSIGSELCRQLIACHPQKLLCADRNETGMFYLHRELEKLCPPGAARFCVTDISIPDEISRFCRTERPQIIFHAAAYKHAPLMQSNVRQAVRNNVFGLLALLEAAERNSCESFIFISSDKSVSPMSAMGATKRVGELILSTRPSSMRCLAVRFGNVLGSNGSIVPILQEQIRTSGELTITHPDVRRFFMTIHEAVSLVVQASSIGEHGEILVLDMGEPLRIVDLAKTLVRLSGKSEEELRIRFSGLRPGEKLCEELFHAHESVAPTAHPKIRIARAPLDDWSALETQLSELRLAMEIGSDHDISSSLFSIVAAHSPQSRAASVFAPIEESEPALLHRAARA
ncbi:MAG TPA: nucleoside-diphosphate sugar epimerase/dehydratase [Candidatus Acidoferrales bacterium]|nr:nucleoside-diphosphate sugar epimerase/dehydratase [Candidatus Acidoferrales bacterium]